MGTRTLAAFVSVTLLAAGIVVAFVLQRSEDDTKTSQGDSDDPRAAVPDTQSVKHLVAEREKFDSTVWSKEVAAQKYEEPFIELWDNLRTAKDRVGELAAFPFEKLTLGLPGEPAQHNHGIEAFRCDNGTRSFTPQEWKNWLNELRKSGFRLVQSEWHHSRFEPDVASPRSIVSVVLHVANDASKARYDIKGKLTVHWKPESSESDKPRADRIEATDFGFLSRKRVPLFEEAAVLKSRTPRRMMLTAYDLDGNGPIRHHLADRQFGLLESWELPV